MRRWIQNCEESHSMCRLDSVHPQREANKYFPGRLLHVGDTQASRLHLSLGNSLSAGENYVTLSHRWETNAPIRLNNSSLESFMDEIPLESLPSTFKDAVTITREFRFRYFMDRLCVLSKILRKTGSVSRWRWQAYTKMRGVILQRLKQWAVKMGALRQGVLPMFCPASGTLTLEIKISPMTHSVSCILKAYGIKEWRALDCLEEAG
jgi:hypothetical protein